MGRPAIDLTGDRFGRLTVLYRIEGASNKHNGSAVWECVCDCGNHKAVSAKDLRAGTRQDGSGRYYGIRSCGCLMRETASAMGRGTKTHGETANLANAKSSEYGTWIQMKSRCVNKNNPQWKDYGGRGIRVCQEWQESFEAFLAHVGRRPEGDYSIDRIDNDGDYEPGNVRWATRIEQQNNRSVQPGRSPRYVFDLIDALPFDIRIDFGKHAVPDDVRAYLEARRTS